MTSSPRPRLPGELVFTFVLLAGSVFLFWAAWRISGFASVTSAGAFPMAAAGTMVVSGLLIALKTSRAPAETPDAGESRTHHFRRRVLPPVLLWMLVVLLTYMFGLERLGFIPASYAFLVAGMWLLGERRWLVNLGVSGLALAIIYVIFRVVFTVVLPTGSIWPGLLP